jgi:hypothetical protein
MGSRSGAILIWIIVPHEKVTDSLAKLCTSKLIWPNYSPDPTQLSRLIASSKQSWRGKLRRPNGVKKPAGRQRRPAGFYFKMGWGTTHARSGGTQATQSSSTSRCIGTRQHQAIRRRLVELQCSKTVNRVGKVRTERTSAINRQKICGWQRKRQGLCNRYLKTSGEAKLRVVLPSIGHETDASESQDHHRPGGGLGDGCLYASNKQLRDLDVASCLIKADRTHNDGK